MLHRAPDQPQTADHDRVAGELMSVEDAIARYRDEWVLMDIADWHERHGPKGGYVLAHSARRDAITDVVVTLPTREERSRTFPDRMYYVFYAVPRITFGPTYEAAVTKFIADFEAMKKEQGAGAIR